MTATAQQFPAGFDALVIGASRGIGAALVTALLERGAGRVWAASRSGSVPQDDPRVRLLRLDVTDETSLAEATAHISAEASSLALAIHTPGLLQDAAIRPERRLAELNLAALQKSFAVNAFGPVLAAKHVLPLLAHGGRAVFASLSARVGSIGDNHLGGWYAYRASKAAQNMLMRTFAIEWRRLNRESICVLLHPGTTDTDLSVPFQANVPEGKLFTAEFVAERLLAVIAKRTAEDSGNFYAWDGQPIPW